MLGRIYTGRLPTTQANLDLINARIRKVQSDMTILDNQVNAGQIDDRVAAYKRQQLIGEVDELRRVIANSRLSTPSYKTPSDIRTGKPAKKYISYSDSRAFISDYDGPAPINKVPSNWQATELTELDVPDLTVQTGAYAMWPSHWPGNHSPMILEAVMQTGEVNGRQLIDPRTKSMKLQLDMVNYYVDMEAAIMLRARYEELQKTVKGNPAFTYGDSSLVNMIIGKINIQITEAEGLIAERRRSMNAAKEIEEAAQRKIDNPYTGQDDTSSGNEEVQTIPGTGDSDQTKVGAESGYKKAEELLSQPKKVSSNIPGWDIYKIDITSGRTGEYLRSKFYAMHNKYGFAPATPEGGQLYVNHPSDLPAAIDKRIVEYEEKFKKETKYVTYEYAKHGMRLLRFTPKPSAGQVYKEVVVYEKQQVNKPTKYNYNYFYDGKLFTSANGQPKRTPKQIMDIPKQLGPFLFNGQNSQFAENGHPLVLYAAGGKGAYDSLGGHKKPARMRRRNGSLMGIGAMQSHDRYNNMSPEHRVISRTQRQSYLTTERELSLAKKRAGAKIDVTQELKAQPVTRPWSMQVTAPVQDVEQLHIMLDSSLQSIGLTQGMLTQQAHNYIAELVNSLDSSMRPSDRTEFVVEKIMSEMVNRSALLRDDVRVDVRQNGWPPVNITPADTNSVDNLGGAFLKTKAAMGRLLG